jgi:hypothetical protein
MRKHILLSCELKERKRTYAPLSYKNISERRQALMEEEMCISG